MNDRINLLVPEKHDPVLDHRIQVLRILSLSFLFVIVIASVGLFFLILSSPLPALRAEESRATSELRTKQKTSGMLYLLRDRLGSIEGIINSRPKIKSLTEKVSSKIPENVFVDRIVIEQSTVTLSFSSYSLLFLSSAIEDIKNLTNEKLFSSVTLATLTYDADRQVYVATLAMTL
jgi:hypothetical protein